MDADQRLKSPKHRSTCDNCKKSKVRCSQERPFCSRCLRQGAECTYSLSRRAGRPRLNRPFPKHTPPGTTQLSLESPLQQGSSDSSGPNDTNANANTSTNTHSNTSTDISIDGSANNGSNTSAATSTVTSTVAGTGNETSAVGVELSTLSTASLELQWAVSTSTFGFPPPDATPGLFDLDFDTIFASESFDTQPDSGLDSIGTDPRSGEEKLCSCAAELLNCLFDTHAGLGPAEDGASRVLSAITVSRRVLDICQRVLCCTHCKPRRSTTLMLCHAADQVSIALDVGSVWGDSGKTRYYPQGDGLAREDVLLRYGNYTIEGAKRRLVLRSMLIRRLTNLQEVMDMASRTIDSLDPSTLTPYEKTLVGLVTEVSAMISSKVHLVSLSL